MEMERNTMPTRLSLGIAGAALIVLAVAGCATPAAPPADPSPTTASETSEPTPELTADLSVADTSLGSIVVDSFGLTVYYYDADTAGSGVSTCAGDCLVAWPAVHPINDEPVLDGVTGEVGVITGTDGKPQLTMNGLPLYYFVKDKAPGHVTGQGKAGVWWVVAPDGSKITD
jgi:predicted lipoprotein with Yx(FWY)xxD motif